MTKQKLEPTGKIHRALMVAFRSGSADNGPHKDWIIDQMVRELTGDDYWKWVETFEGDENGERVYHWPVGVTI